MAPAAAIASYKPWVWWDERLSMAITLPGCKIDTGIRSTEPGKMIESMGPLRTNGASNQSQRSALNIVVVHQCPPGPIRSHAVRAALGRTDESCWFLPGIYREKPNEKGGRRRWAVSSVVGDWQCFAAFAPPRRALLFERHFQWTNCRSNAEIVTFTPSGFCSSFNVASGRL